MKMIITTVHKDRVLTVIGPWCIKAEATTRLVIQELRDRGVRNGDLHSLRAQDREVEIRFYNTSRDFGNYCVAT